MNNLPAQHVLQRIKSSYNQLSEKEKLIANYILSNPQNIIHLTINQIAEDLHIADATVFRFCKRIGFKGYQAMKIALASEVVHPIKDIHETITEEDNEPEITDKVFKSNIRAIEETLEIMNKDTITKAVKMILHARRIEFYGNGGSGIVALDAHHKFMRTGKTSIAYTDTHMQLMSVSQLTSEDVAVFISHSGSNKNLLEVLKVAKDNNVKTISITNFAKSPLSKQTDLALYTVAQETEFRSEALASRIAELSFIDALYVNVSIAEKNKSKDSLSKIRKAISLIRM